jgi:hypothetical protein
MEDHLKRVDEILTVHVLSFTDRLLKSDIDDSELSSTLVESERQKYDNF